MAFTAQGAISCYPFHGNFMSRKGSYEHYPQFP
ncbi:hypothetical protein FHR31_001019 [Parvibacter caecicola]|uniref:Uncharacterized protein n=1 Tax=Parvibacter caecicola TaxID=747645 RepID=A0A7W5D208_9ACTN|nr:hypothetical protein [Parvibacter caecicola]